MNTIADKLEKYKAAGVDQIFPSLRVAMHSRSRKHGTQTAREEG